MFLRARVIAFQLSETRESGFARMTRAIIEQRYFFEGDFRLFVIA